MTRERFRFFDLPVFDKDGDGAAPPPASGDETVVSGETNVPGDSSEGSFFEGLGGFDEIEISDAGDAQASQGEPLPQASAAPASTPSGGLPPPVPTAPPAAAAPAPVAPPAPAPAAAPAPAPSPDPSVQAPANEAPASASAPMDPAGLLQQLSTHKEELISSIANDQRFQLSADEATALETNPAQAFPRLAARIFYEATNATLAHINNFVPAMVMRMNRGAQMQRDAEDAFYGQFKQLDRSKHDKDVRTFGNIIKQTHPNLPKADFFAMIAAAVMAKNGIASVAAPAAAPVIPSQPAFTPAAPGATVRSVPVEEHPFAGLGKDWEN